MGDEGATAGELGTTSGDGEGGALGDDGIAPSPGMGGDSTSWATGEGDGGADCSSSTNVCEAWREKEIGGAREEEDVGLDEDSAMLRRLVGRANGLLGRSPVVNCEGRRTNGLDFSGDREGDSGFVGDSDRSRTVEGERRSPSESGRRKGDARGERGELKDNLVGDA